MEPLEPSQSQLPTWVLLEYTHMLSLASPSSTVHFSNLSPNLAESLSAHLHSATSDKKDQLAKFKVTQEGVEQLGLDKDKSRVCLLDPKAEQPLEPADVDAFDTFLFGGILGAFVRMCLLRSEELMLWHLLGDDPPRDRTGELRAFDFPSRHLGPVQMTVRSFSCCYTK
jgi:ribosome biogenesis SPOUT family RNA methylase Rps3